MRILLIGDFTGRGDEGLSKISKTFLDLISDQNEVLKLNTKETILPLNVLKIIKFNPDIIHYITGVTIRSFIVAKLLKLICLNKPKTIISAIRAFLTSSQISFIKYVKPTLILTQAQKWETIFQEKGITTKFLPNPVDTNKFKRSDVNKDMIRRKYNLPLDKKIILHVGHIRKNRNIESLVEVYEKLNMSSYQVVLVASSYFSLDIELYNRLNNSGLIIITDYINNIEEIYNSADIYLFPTKGLQKEYFPKEYQEVGVIDLPLSLLEALAVGLPIITTHVDSLERLINNYADNNIFYWNGENSEMPELLEKVESLKKVENEKHVQQFANTNIKIVINSIYEMILRQN